MKTIDQIRADFPILERAVYGRKLVYLDNGATTQKPQCVIDTLNEVYRLFNANIHRGVHALSDMASDAYENARSIVKSFINAEKSEEIIFTSGTTGAINMVAFSFGERFVGEGDEIVLSSLEHHSNLVPWQMLCERKKATLKIIPVDDNGNIMFDDYLRLLGDKVKIVSIPHVSNALGVILPVGRMIEAAHERGIPVMIDGAQGIQHGFVDVKELDCDFYAFSGHKIYGPTGIGVLYGKEKYLAEMPPYQGGGDMVDRVTFEKTTYNELPFKFEAGTTNFADAVGLGRALEYVNEVGRDRIAELEADLIDYASKVLSEINGLKIYGNSFPKAPIVSFLLDNIHQYDAGMILDKLGIAVRTGTHCAQPIMDRFGIEGTIRASMCFYNTRDEIDALAAGIVKVKEMFL